MKITLRQLEVFDAVATQGTVRGAAARLGLSQSAVSGALSDLQIITRRTLFAHNKGRSVQITEEGQRLRPKIRALLSRALEIEADTKAPLCGTLVVGASAQIAETSLPEICVAFLALHPGVHINIVSATAGELYQSVARFELETALIENFPDLEGIELTKWRTDELWLVAAPSHPLAGRQGLRIKDLAGARWCSREPHASVSSRLRILLHEELGQTESVFIASNNAAVKLAAMAGGGIACLSRSFVAQEIASGALIRLDLVDFRFTRSLNLARPIAMGRTRLARSFDAFLLAHGDQGLEARQSPEPNGVFTD